MRASSLLGLSGGWLLTSLFLAWDVGRADDVFLPTLSLGLPAAVGLAISVSKFRKAPEPVQPLRFIGFTVLGALIAVVAVVAVVAGLNWASPPPLEGELTQ